MKRCRYCQRAARLLRYGDDGYPYARDYGPMWVCAQDQAWVGCHPGTEKALGSLANAELRDARRAAHAAFDPIWKKAIQEEGRGKGQARRRAYRWLSEQLGLPYKETHIGYMDAAACWRVVEACSRQQKVANG